MKIYALFVKKGNENPVFCGVYSSKTLALKDFDKHLHSKEVSGIFVEDIQINELFNLRKVQ